MCIVNIYIQNRRKQVTREKLFTRIYSLHNFLYRYWDDEIKDYDYVVLGYCESSEPRDFRVTEYHTELLNNMLAIYCKEEITEDDKGALASLMHKLQRKCDYCFDDRKSKNQQKEFINALNDRQYSELCTQVDMYMYARELFGQGYR